MIESLQDFTSTFPPALAWLAVMLAAAIPFVESYFGAAIGVVIGVNPVIAILAAVVGNVASMLLMVNGAHFLRRKASKGTKEPSQKYVKLRAAFDKYGIAGVSLLGQTILPSQITSAALVSFGASKEKVIFWQVISIILWGTAFGLLVYLGIDVIGAR
ncbi:hypothetical protein [Paeniglutamicibacter sp. Y32M11]|jgi:membrane protein DedA with SNARE-associated domain|uniref:hypothetical protein n=1 Tax=Paeniglutamicibacter sp. Y32M11 TaxID=2853258 RepID=UPI00104833C7|nr:hypothetical protein [Paeniglutamicibacter sp. Y32M11]QXQ09488.1 hypothetical protein KUF55_13540 [Paeniglutamicibacter sp. Y32M11]